jgi:hypothetical protein
MVKKQRNLATRKRGVRINENEQQKTRRGRSFYIFGTKIRRRGGLSGNPERS